MSDEEYQILKAVSGEEAIEKAKTYSNDWEDKVPNAGWRIDKVYSALKEKADEDGGIAIVILDEIDTLVSKSGDDILYHLTGTGFHRRHI